MPDMWLQPRPCKLQRSSRFDCAVDLRRPSRSLHTASSLATASFSMRHSSLVCSPPGTEDALANQVASELTPTSTMAKTLASTLWAASTMLAVSTMLAKARAARGASKHTSRAALDARSPVCCLLRCAVPRRPRQVHPPYDCCLRRPGPGRGDVRGRLPRRWRVGQHGQDHRLGRGLSLQASYAHARSHSHSTQTPVLLAPLTPLLWCITTRAGCTTQAPARL